MRALKLVGAAVVAASLTACGGGGGGFGLSDYYGSIAVNKLTGAAGITANYNSQWEANMDAINTCGGLCVTVLEFGPYQCGSLARSQSGPLVLGWASKGDLYDSKIAAISECTARGGLNCEYMLAECNN